MKKKSERRKIGITIILAFAVLFATLVFLSAIAGCASGRTAPEEEWNKSFGGTNHDSASSVQQTTDGGYILVGLTRSYGAGGGDAWLVKTNSNGSEMWNRTFGDANFDTGYSVQQTTDGGYILVGYTNSYGAGGTDCWLVKTDSNGTEAWNKTFGGLSYEEAYSVQQTTDGGYILAGRTRSYGAGKDDCWLVKTYSNGTEVWNKTFGGTDYDWAKSVQQTTDGGYILAGGTESYGDGLQDVWLLKTDSSGNEQWNKTFGGTGFESSMSVQQTEDGGYILAGYTTSYGSGSNDFWLLKIDCNGTEQWNQTFGGTDADLAFSVQQTPDGGYILTGYTISYGAGYMDFWLVKTDSSGNEQWNKTFGGPNFDEARSVQQTVDGGYILAGYTGWIPEGFKYSYGTGDSDFWLIKVKGEEPIISIFDTGPSENPYPSIMGTHKGEIKPSDNINVSKLYTYPCPGTSGHTESIKLYENGELIASGTWNGYQNDYHNITINNVSGAHYVMLYKGHKYNYTIVTGSYPQIIHEPSKEVTGGTITCTSFVDANGKIYTDWIPAIRLE